MQTNSTPTLKKSEPFTTNNPDLNNLLKIWYEQGMAMDAAEQAHLPEPIFKCPSIPTYVNNIKFNK